MAELGYAPGRNLTIEDRWAEGRLDRLPGLAAELAQMPVDVLVVAGPSPLQAVRKATTTIPIVMIAGSSDPVGEGVAASLARPGGNITGLTYAVSVLDAAGIDGAFATMRQQRADALLVAIGGPTHRYRGRVAEMALGNRLPTIAAFKEFTADGGLLSYGPDFPELYRRGATYVDRILKGAKPGDLPIELPTKYEFVVNLKSAKVLGLAIPQSLLLRANEVIA